MTTAIPAPPPVIASPSQLAPVAPMERLSSVDTLRGFALLGILAMNIVAFALPSAAYMNPMVPGLQPYQGPFEGLNRLSWIVAHVLFEQKMMSIFSMLFGAGLVLMGGRAESGGRRGFASFYYRRLLWLFVIGMIHAYLIWYGDILVAYAICGVFLYPVRRVRPIVLIILGVVVMLIPVVITGGVGALMTFMRATAQEAQNVIAAGNTPTDFQQDMLDAYHETVKGMTPDAATIDADVAAMRGSFSEVFNKNAEGVILLQGKIFVLWTFWRALGLMLIGMGLMKTGVFAAARSWRFYTVLALAGLGVGMPMAYAGAHLHIQHKFDMIASFTLDWHLNYIGSFLVALGYVGVVMLVCKSGVLPGLRARLAAVGRMALTNYLMQSLLMTFIFYGWGLGYFGHIERAQLYLFVVGVWILQLVISPIWLEHFRFGPAEWLWRSLTYWKPQPMRRTVAGVHS